LWTNNLLDKNMPRIIFQYFGYFLANLPVFCHVDLLLNHLFYARQVLRYFGPDRASFFFYVFLMLG